MPRQCKNSMKINLQTSNSSPKAKTEQASEPTEKEELKEQEVSDASSTEARDESDKSQPKDSIASSEAIPQTEAEKKSAGTPVIPKKPEAVVQPKEPDIFAEPKKPLKNRKKTGIQSCKCSVPKVPKGNFGNFPPRNFFLGGKFPKSQCGLPALLATAFVPPILWWKCTTHRSLIPAKVAHFEFY